jgi:hypothetical protein
VPLPNDDDSDDGEEEDAEEETEEDDMEEDISPYQELGVGADETVCFDFLKQFEVKESRSQGNRVIAKQKVCALKIPSRIGTPKRI